MKLSRAILAVVLFVAGWALWTVAESSLAEYMDGRQERAVEMIGG